MMSLAEQTGKWIKHLKLDHSLYGVIPQVHKIYAKWKNWVQNGVLPDNFVKAPLPVEHHGKMTIRDDGTSEGIIAQASSKSRQALALVHELLHEAFGREQPLHKDLHTLAGGLAHAIFPAQLTGAGTQMTFLDSDQRLLLNTLRGVTHYGGQVESDVDELSDEVVVLSDANGRVVPARRSRSDLQGPSPVGLRYATSPMPASRIVDNEVTAAILSKYRGWIVPYLIKMFEAQTLILPLRGAHRCTPLFDYSGWKSPDLGGWWAQLMTAMDATSNSKSIKSYVQTFPPEPLGATAGCLEVLLNPSGNTTYTRTIGMIVRISPPGTPQNRGVRVAAFTSAAFTDVGGAVVKGPRGRMYILFPNYNDKVMVGEFIILCTENDRGAAAVSGIDTNAADAKILIPSIGNNVNGVCDLPTGSYISVESINYRDIMG